MSVALFGFLAICVVSALDETSSDNSTTFDCNTYSSCTECVTSSVPCDWCVDGHRCTHDTSENCRNDVYVNGDTHMSPGYRRGPDFCPSIKTTNPQEILVPFGITKNIVVKVRIIGQFIVQTRFVCQFNIEGRVTSVNGRLLADTMYCDDLEFSYKSHVPSITVPFAVVWGGSKPLDNPGKIHVVVYRCREMAENCGQCMAIPDKYNCGWCQSSNSCEVRKECDRGNGSWLNRDTTCPIPEIQPYKTTMEPWKENTNVTETATAAIEVAGTQTWNGTCEPGKLFKFYCNTCECPANGLRKFASCTLMMCSMDIWNEDGTLKVSQDSTDSNPSETTLEVNRETKVYSPDSGRSFTHCQREQEGNQWLCMSAGYKNRVFGLLLIIPIFASFFAAS